MTLAGIHCSLHHFFAAGEIPTAENAIAEITSIGDVRIDRTISDHFGYENRWRLRTPTTLQAEPIDIEAIMIGADPHQSMLRDLMLSDHDQFWAIIYSDPGAGAVYISTFTALVSKIQNTAQIDDAVRVKFTLDISGRVREFGSGQIILDWDDDGWEYQINSYARSKLSALMPDTNQWLPGAAPFGDGPPPPFASDEPAPRNTVWPRYNILWARRGIDLLQGSLIMFELIVENGARIFINDLLIQSINGLNQQPNPSRELVTFSHRFAIGQRMNLVIQAFDEEGMDPRSRVYFALRATLSDF